MKNTSAAPPIKASRAAMLTPLGRLRDLRMLSARASYAGLNSSKIASQERPC